MKNFYDELYALKNLVRTGWLPNSDRSKRKKTLCLKSLKTIQKML